MNAESIPESEPAAVNGRPIDLADDAPGPVYRITILCDLSTDEDREAGDVTTETITVSEIFDAEDLRSLERRYGPFETLAAPMQMSAEIVPLKSSYHAEDRDFFEKGIQRYYRLHLEEVDGRAAVPADMVAFAGYLGCGPDRVADEHGEATPAIQVPGERPRA